MNITEVVTVANPVTDQDRALEFYTRTLGLEKVRDVPMGDDKRWIEVAPPGAATTIALLSAGTSVGRRLTAPDAATAHAALTAQGATTDPEIVPLGAGHPPMLSFCDPDGNVLTIVEGTR
jgi:catechol 2,3-dioxygenase-like lactoylglutathione lyase family enzyme